MLMLLHLFPHVQLTMNYLSNNVNSTFLTKGAKKKNGPDRT